MGKSLTADGPAQGMDSCVARSGCGACVGHPLRARSRCHVLRHDFSRREGVGLGSTTLSRE